MEMDHPETLGWLKDALAEETAGLRLHHHHLEWSWKRITTDSREAGEGDVFVAIPGERFDGHDYARKASEAGAVCLVVEHEIHGADAAQIIVRNARRALARIARAWRARFSCNLTAVGGSNGKTTTTQMVAAILRERWGADEMLATEGNFNNDIGVSHTLMGLRFRHRAAVVEAGMNHRGEMAVLADMIRPTVAVLTNAQREHQAFLETVAETASENGLLIAALPESGHAVFPADDPCSDVWASLALARGVKSFTFSFDPAVPADLMCRLDADGALALEGEKQSFQIALRIAGLHNARNAAAAAAAALIQDIDPEIIRKALESFEALPGRGARMHAAERFGGAILIDDAYNCNPDSAIASLRMLAREKAPRIFIFGDMAELGPSSEKWHAEVGAEAKRLGIDYFWTAGEKARAGALAFGTDGDRCRAFRDRDELIEALPELKAEGGTIVVKASHSAGFSKIVDALSGK
ncbi:UDP-N-acetylmuramoyl-tripeptide--D-alanyl-D-alanine ligase [uncultured Sutterella sp.]|uniref:UDP-N-acetylmuramoyl-tripeptide--D-alanyl-D- alanine ligase n=1 Tax=uncultured Sutterella sp. TaxID=286133 RepID=UPI002601CD80|nr:UDP-N-acetylmuramoyl-tripeptide--D-alanyl-D-alanine ligase [uncultured Sutterella sp.]